ncbi:MAG: tail fiber domain-containing protein [Candidatus Omnitrophota bacterium]|jgi:hypothetical protein
MFNFKKLHILCVIFLLFFFISPCSVLAEDTLTITTYYPSPYGVYREMRAKRIAIGDNYIDNADYTWEESDGDGGEIDYLADLVVEGNVGIGTTAITDSRALLHLANSKRISFQGNTGVANSRFWRIGNDDMTAWGNFDVAVGDNNSAAPSASNQVVMTLTKERYVGIGTTAPVSKFVVQSAGSPYNAGVFLGGTTAFSILPYNGLVFLSAGTYYENGTWQYRQASGSSLFVIGETDGAHWYSGTGASYSNVASNVSLWNASGTWIGSSSRKLKENFIQLDPDDLLNKINQLDITRWNFKSEGKSITHIGPVAEDFYRIFETGDAENHLATLDTAGVSLAGVKALYAKVKSQQNKIESLESSIQQLKERVDLLEKEPRSPVEE